MGEQKQHQQRRSTDQADQSFQKDIFFELREEDELVILARGLGLLRLVTNVLHSYDAAGNNLVVLVGADDRENGWIGESLAEHAAVSMSPKARGLNLVNTELMSVATRQQMYARGGVFSITSRILIVDFLSGLLNPKSVTGVIVLHSERVIATSVEAFILRVYRQQNKEGFLKAFSDQPEPFSSGFAPLSTMMRNLFLRRPSLWPRFHATVATALEGKKKAEVIELEVSMTEGMKDIQNAVLDCVEQSIGELKRSNAGLDMEDWNIDSALHRNFDSIIRRQLDPVWHRTSFKTRQIVRDLTLLRTILHAVISYDSVSLNKYLDTVLAASSPAASSNRQNQSPWLFLPAADTLFTVARKRVYAGDLRNIDFNGVTTEFPESLRPVLEEQPKWAVLADVLQEIERDVYFNPTISDDSNSTVLIMAGDGNTCRQIKDYLGLMHVQPNKSNKSNGKAAEAAADGNDDDEDFRPSGAAMMRRKLRSYIEWKGQFARVKDSLYSEHQKSISNENKDQRKHTTTGRGPPTKRRRVRGGGAATGISAAAAANIHTAGDRDAHIAALLAELQPNEAELEQKADVGNDPLEAMEDYYQPYDMGDLVLVHPYDGDLDEHVLEEVRPRYVIMYEPDPAFIRRVEVYRSSHTDRAVRVYFMYYGGSVEEQRYLSAVRREKDAFTRLIRERGSMTVTLTLDAHGVEDQQEQFLRTVNTRIAGGGRLAATSEPPKVVVDVREFRSSLASLLHGRNMQVIPCLLTVGDYVLTPTICVERKSVRDLIASFNNGRLYNQAETMLQHYKNPFLLIEFDMGKSFTLEPFTDMSGMGTGTSKTTFTSLTPQLATDLQSKLVLLTLAFPRLKIIWSSSPYQTAEIFEELKKNQDEPDPLRASQIGLEEQDEDGDEGGFNIGGKTFSTVPLDMLRCVPGVGEKTLQAIMLDVSSVQELSNMEEEKLSEYVGKEAGRQIVRFFNRSVFDD